MKMRGKVLFPSSKGANLVNVCCRPLTTCISPCCTSITLLTFEE